jgi:hypothetical protein
MDDFFIRQVNILEELIGGYRREDVGLNLLIQRIGGISELLSMAEWKDAVFPVVFSMEQINAFTLYTGKSLTEAEKVSVNDSLFELEALINRFKQRPR